MHILTTQLIYKKAASKMSKNKNIFFRTPAPSLPHKRARKSGCKENRFTFVQEMLHPLWNLHQAGDTATTRQLAVGRKPRGKRSFESKRNKRMPWSGDRNRKGVAHSRKLVRLMKTETEMRVFAKEQRQYRFTKPGLWTGGCIASRTPAHYKTTALHTKTKRYSCPDHVSSLALQKVIQRHKIYPKHEKP